MPFSIILQDKLDDKYSNDSVNIKLLFGTINLIKSKIKSMEEQGSLRKLWMSIRSWLSNN